MKRTLSLVLVLAMVFSAMLGVISFAETDETPKALEVTHANLEFASAVYLYVAVDYSAFGSANGITLSIKNKVTGAEVILNPTTSITAPANHVAFKYTQLGAQNMGDELLIQALKDGVASGEAKTYSVLEYALVAQGQGDAKLTNLMKAMLQYGMDAQKAFGHKNPTYDLSKEYSFTKLVGGAYFEDGSTKVIMGEGSAAKTATIAKATNSTAWYNTNRAPLGVGKTLSVSYAPGGQIVYAALGTPFDMRTYAGTGIITEHYDGTTYSITDASGTAVSRPTDWIYDGKEALKGQTVDTNRKFLWNLDGDYLEYTQGSTEIFFNHSRFFTPDMYQQVVANGGKFTISITMATSDISKAMGTFMFRSFTEKTMTVTDYNTGEKQSIKFAAANKDTSNQIPIGLRDSHKLPFLNGATAGKLFSPYNNYGGTSKATNAFAQIPLTADEFITVDIVVDLFAKCTMYYHNRTGTTCYLCGSDGKIDYDKDGSTKTTNDIVKMRCNACNAGETYAPTTTKRCETCNMVGTVPAFDYYVNGVKVNTNVVCPSVSAEYFNTNLTFYNICSRGSGKIQSIIVSPLDIVNTK